MLTLKAEVYILRVSRCTKKVVMIEFVVGKVLILKTVFLFEIRAESRVKICIKVTSMFIQTLIQHSPIVFNSKMNSFH